MWEEMTRLERDENEADAIGDILYKDDIYEHIRDWCIEKLDTSDTDWVYIRKVENHIEIGPAKVEMIR